MKRLSYYAGIALLVALFVPSGAQAQTPFAVHAVAVEGGLYSPRLDFYTDSPEYLLDFASGPLLQGHLEAELFEVVMLRGSIGYWTQDASDEIAVNDPLNARVHEGSLRIIPISGTLYYGFPYLTGGMRPIIGAGITQNLIERSFGRDPLNRDTGPDTFDANGRSYTYHVVGGVHSRLSGPVWLGVEGRYVTGSYTEETDGDVDLSGWQASVSLRYHLGR